MPLDSADDALKWVRERMDLLAFTTPRDVSWEEIYKQLRHEVAEVRADKTKTGRILTPEDFEELATEAERDTPLPQDSL